MSKFIVLGTLEINKDGGDDGGNDEHSNDGGDDGGIDEHSNDDHKDQVEEGEIIGMYSIYYYLLFFFIYIDKILISK